MVTPTRADEIARPLRDEIVRQEIVDLLDGRWRHALTLVTAPGGYGKTRALAQAVRSNAEDPVGNDVYLRLRPAHGDRNRMVEALLAVLGDASAPSDQDVPVDRVIDALAAAAPTRVCLIVDDVHVLDDAAGSIGLLEELIRALPTNSHVLIAGRRVPPLGLARLRAEDGVLDVGPAQLAFDSDEVALVADHYGVDPAMLEPLAGWPALVRLAVVAGKTGPQEFLMQEIVDDLPARLAHALLVAALAGSADAELLARCGSDVTPAELAAGVPLVDPEPDGSVRPHDLWQSLRPGLDPARDRSELAPVVARWHSEHRRHDEAVMVALGAGDNDLARELLMHALDGSDLWIRAGSTGRWLDAFGGAGSVRPDDAELLLLRGWHERLAHGPGNGDDDVAAALGLFEARGDALGEARASVEHAFRGFLAGDPGPVLDAVERSPRLVREGVTFLRPLGEMTRAIIAELGGDFERSLRHSLRALEAEPRREFAELTLRHRAGLFFLVGDGEGAVRTAHELVTHTPSIANRHLLAMVQFATGDIDPVVDSWPEMRYFETGNVREDFSLAVVSVFIDACLGIDPDLSRVRAVAWDRARERLQIALCEWSAELLAGNENSANQALSDQLTELGLDDPLVEGECRRYLVSVCVADPVVLAHFEAAEARGELGPYHRERLGLARLLLGLRSGRGDAHLDAYLGPDHTIGAMSLPWSVEIACGLVAHDRERAFEFVDVLFARCGSRTRRWLRHVAESGRATADGAATLLAELPAPPEGVTTISTQPSVVLHRTTGSTPVTRIRVRQLLLILALRRSLSRDRAMTMLWPDKEPARARNNLRITLSHLRSELEPDRRRGEPSYHLRRRGQEISLRPSEYLRCDLWDMVDALERGQAISVAGGDRSARLAALEPVADLWQPPLLDDLVDIPELSAEVMALRARVRDATIDVAEGAVSSGQYERALELGSKLLSQDRYDERAHAAVIAALLGLDRPTQVLQAIDVCLEMLSELGVSPAPATRMLLRRARYDQDSGRRTA